MAGESIPARYLEGYIEVADRNGISATELLDVAGLSADLLVSGEGLVAIADVKKLLIFLLEKTADPAFGLHYGPTLLHGALTLFSDFSRFAANMRQICNLVLRYQSILLPGIKLELKEDEKDAQFIISFFPEIILSQQEKIVLTDVMLSSMLRFAQTVGLAKFQVDKIWLAYPTPVYATEFVTLFACKAQFFQNNSGIQFSKSWLDETPLSALPAQNKKMEQQASERLESLQTTAQIVETIVEHIKAEMGSTELSLEAIAQRMQLAPRTLQRQLKLANTSFHDLKDQVRMEQAQIFLAENGLQIEAIACHLGYSDAAAFSNSFKRIKGLSPSAYRKSLHDAGSRRLHPNDSRQNHNFPSDEYGAAGETDCSG